MKYLLIQNIYSHSLKGYCPGCMAQVREADDKLMIPAQGDMQLGNMARCSAKWVTGP